VSKIIHNRKAVSVLPCFFGAGDRSKLTTKLPSLNHHDTVPQSPSTHARSRPQRRLAALNRRCSPRPTVSNPSLARPAHALAAMASNDAPQRLGVPSRNPLPLSASQESQVRDIYYARVRNLCSDEIKGNAETDLPFPISDKPKALLTTRVRQQPLPTAPSAAPSPSPSSAASSTAR
jgi:hypothetical protein